MNAEIILHLQKKELEKIKSLINDLKDVANIKEIREDKELRVEFV